MKLRKKITFKTTFATYTSQEIIGQGGSGQIYKAKDESGYIYAIKLLDPNKSTKDEVRRFKNELIFCSINEHPNIVSVIDNGIFLDKEKKSPFFVMQLYGSFLRNMIRDAVPHEKILRYFSHIMDGLETAHLKKVIHRDMKPENILYDKETDNLLIADFGITRFEEEELFTAVETRNKDRLANFQYAEPEQRSRSAKVDHRTDIFVLGLILNEMFTGDVPQGTGYKTIESINKDYGYLDRLVSKMLRQSTTERPSDIRSIKQILIGYKNEFVTMRWRWAWKFIFCPNDLITATTPGMNSAPIVWPGGI